MVKKNENKMKIVFSKTKKKIQTNIITETYNKIKKKKQVKKKKRGRKDFL